MFDVSIVIPTHNRAAVLERTLASVAQLDMPPDITVELVVVASACTDGTLEVVRRTEGKLPCAVQAIDESRTGLSVARNRGLEAARADLIAFLDDDVWVEREWLKSLVQAASHTRGHLFAGRVTLEWESRRPEWTSPAVERLLSANDHGGEMRELAAARGLVGANFALHRSVIDRVGNFSVSLGRHGSDLLSGEESDLVARALAAGYRLFYVPQMAVRHWISHERATVAHLEALAFGRGRTRVALLRGDRRNAFASVRLGAAQVLLGSARELGGWWRRDRAKGIAARLLRQRGLGVLSALLHAGIRNRAAFGDDWKRAHL